MQINTTTPNTADRYCPNCRQMVRPLAEAKPLVCAGFIALALPIMAYIWFTYSGSPDFLNMLGLGGTVVLVLAVCAGNFFGLQYSCPICKSANLVSGPSV